MKFTPSDLYYIAAHYDQPAHEIAVAIGRRPLAKTLEAIDHQRTIAAQEADQAQATKEVITTTASGKKTVALMTQAGAMRETPPAKKSDVPSRALEGAIFFQKKPKLGGS